MFVYYNLTSIRAQILNRFFYSWNEKYKQFESKWANEMVGMFYIDN